MGSVCRMCLRMNNIYCLCEFDAHFTVKVFYQLSVNWVIIFWKWTFSSRQKGTNSCPCIGQSEPWVTRLPVDVKKCGKVESVMQFGVLSFLTCRRTRYLLYRTRQRQDLVCLEKTINIFLCHYECCMMFLNMLTKFKQLCIYIFVKFAYKRN